MTKEIEKEIYCILEDMNRFNLPPKDILEKIKIILNKMEKKI